MRMGTNECVVHRWNEKAKLMTSQIVCKFIYRLRSGLVLISTSCSPLTHSVDQHSDGSSSEAFVSSSAGLRIDAGAVALLRLCVRVRYRAATAI